MKQLSFTIRNTPFGGKVVPHKTDELQLVIKSRHPEVGPMLCQAAGVPVIETKTGEKYSLTVVSKEDLLANLGEALFLAMTGKVEILPTDAAPSYDTAHDVEKDLDEGEALADANWDF